MLDARLAALLLSGIPGCAPTTTPGQDTAGSYQLQLEPLLPENQAGLFDEVTRLQLQIDAADGRSETIEASLGDGSFQAEKVSVFGEATITLLGYDADGDVIAWGRTPPLDLSVGTDDAIQVLVARPEAMAWLEPLESPSAAGALTWDGLGRFLLFGGGTEGSYGSSSGTDDIWMLDLRSREPALGFIHLGTMPPVDEEEGITGRAGHTATLLTGDHADQGKILVVGGAADVRGGQTLDPMPFLWDPETSTVEVLGEDARLRAPTYHHLAVEDPVGNVVIIGGLLQSDGGIIVGPALNYYRASTRETDRILASGASSPFTFASAARLRDEGVLVCGGMELDFDGNFAASDGCDLIDTDGDLSAMDGGGEQLLVPVLHHDMITLSDGRVLLTGGLVTPEGPEAQDEPVEATNRAWIFDEEWSELESSMRLRRAMHEAVLLPDGKVLIVGGIASSTGPLWSGSNGLPCAEIFDPETESFTLVDDCEEGDQSASLPSPAAWPRMATDPERGTLVVGGLDDEDAALSDVSYFLAPIP